VTETPARSKSSEVPSRAAQGNNAPQAFSSLSRTPDVIKGANRKLLVLVSLSLIQVRAQQTALAAGTKRAVTAAKKGGTAGTAPVPDWDGRFCLRLN